LYEVERALLLDDLDGPLLAEDATDLAGDTERSSWRYFSLSGEFRAEDALLSEKTSVFTGLKDRVEGRGGGPLESDLFRSIPLKREGIGEVLVRWKTGFDESLSL
jgi:hypothetical protein